MEKEKLTREINELIIKICEYYGVLGNEQNAIFEYLKSCEKVLLDLLNKFNEKGEKLNKNIPFENVFDYKLECVWLERDKKLLDNEYEILSKEFDKLEERYESKKDNTYDLTKENEKLQEKIKELEDDLFEALRIY